MVSNGSKTYTVDFKKHKLLSEMDFADGENLLEANAQQNAFAYLKGSNLYVRTFDVTSNALTKRRNLTISSSQRTEAAKLFMDRVFTAMSSVSAREPSESERRTARLLSYAPEYGNRLSAGRHPGNRFQSP